MSEDILEIDATESVCGMRRNIIKNLCDDLQKQVLDCNNPGVLGFTEGNLRWVVRQHKRREDWGKEEETS